MECFGVWPSKYRLQVGSIVPPGIWMLVIRLNLGDELFSEEGSK